MPIRDFVRNQRQRKCAAYFESIWNALMSPGSFLEDKTTELSTRLLDTPPLRDGQENIESRRVLYEFARQCLAEKVVKVEVTELENGSVLLGSPRITEPRKFVDLSLQ